MMLKIWLGNGWWLEKRGNEWHMEGAEKGMLVGAGDLQTDKTEYQCVCTSWKLGRSLCGVKIGR